MTTLLRDYDRVGRFGGEEFSVLLPQTRAWMRSASPSGSGRNIAALSIIAPGAGGRRAGARHRVDRGGGDGRRDRPHAS